MTRDHNARLADLLYLVVIFGRCIDGDFQPGVPSQLVDWGNAAATVAKIREPELLFRASIISGFVCYTAFLLLPLYRLFQSVNNTMAVLMVTLVAACVAISFWLFGL